MEINLSVLFLETVSVDSDNHMKKYTLCAKYKVIGCCFSYRLGETMSLNCGHQRAYCSSSQLIYECGDPQWKNQKARSKTCPNAILSTTNPTWTDREQSWASAIRDQRLTAWAMARPFKGNYEKLTTISRVFNHNKPLLQNLNYPHF
jgi:hypothetical protein